jgi:hypothetical protein
MVVVQMGVGKQLGISGKRRQSQSLMYSEATAGLSTASAQHFHAVTGSRNGCDGGHGHEFLILDSRHPSFRFQ